MRCYLDSKILGSVEIINSQLIGTGACLPDFVLTNAMLEHMVDTNDEWIVQRTGVRERRIAKNMHTWELALGAAQDALADAKIDAGELDLILVSTCTPDTNTPNTAAILQDKLGAGAIGAFDINNACTGFVSATDIADCYIKSGKARTVLVVSAETLSRIVDYTDRKTCPIFGDGAAAVLLEPDEEGYGVIDHILHSDGTGAPHLYMKAGGSRYPASEETIRNNWHTITQDGQAVFKAAVSNMADVSVEMMERYNLTSDDIRYLVPHQANLRIIDATANRMGLTRNKCMINIDRYGNTTAATIPLCLYDYEKELKRGDKLILASFGGGYTWGSVYVKWAYDGESAK